MKRFLLCFLFLFSFYSIATITPQVVQVKMETNYGDIILDLDQVRAPESVKNFLSYIKSGFYNGTIFHRVISNFMIQGGGFLPDMIKKPTQAPIKNEANNGLSNSVGTIAMARTSAPHSATSQFFINVVDNARLNYQSPGNYGYAVFGKVSKGMPVVNKIKGVKTGNSGMFQNVPSAPVIIKKMTLL